MSKFDNTSCVSNIKSQECHFRLDTVKKVAIIKHRVISNNSINKLKVLYY